MLSTRQGNWTREVVDKFKRTKGNGRSTIAAMGAGNVISGFLGGMDGNAMQWLVHIHYQLSLNRRVSGGGGFGGFDRTPQQLRSDVPKKGCAAT